MEQPGQGLCGEGDTGERPSASRSRQVRYRAKDKGRAASWGDPQAQKKASCGGLLPATEKEDILGLSGRDSLTVENLR